MSMSDDLDFEPFEEASSSSSESGISGDVSGDLYESDVCEEVLSSPSCCLSYPVLTSAMMSLLRPALPFQSSKFYSGDYQRHTVRSRVHCEQP